MTSTAHGAEGSQVQRCKVRTCRLNWPGPGLRIVFGPAPVACELVARAVRLQARTAETNHTPYSLNVSDHQTGSIKIFGFRLRSAMGLEKMRV